MLYVGDLNGMNKKLFICPYFGDLPPWYDKYKAQFARLEEQGYDVLVDRDLEGFKKRVRDVLGIDAPIVYGEPKVFDYRCALGLLYEKELRHYDWWGTTDFDVVYGDLNKWLTKDLLKDVDIFSNHSTYVSGFFSLYRNVPRVNKLFLQHPFWKDFLTDKQISGWVETGYSNLLENSGLPYAYRSWQGDYTDLSPNLKLENGKLYQDGVEVMCFHFRRSKIWPVSLTVS